MTTPSSPSISVVQPVEPAIERVKQILFRPFDFGKWIAIGFCAWLASLGESGSSFQSPTSSSNTGKPDLGHLFDQARDYIVSNLAWLIPLAALALVILIAIWVVLIWLSSRGRFMLLHCVALDRAEVSVPWRKFSAEANSLWLFRLVFGLAGSLVILPLLAAIAVIVFNLVEHTWQLQPALLVVLSVLTLVFFCLCVLFGIVRCFTTDFVVPIMALRGGTCIEGWRVLLGMVRANPGDFVLYLLFQIVLGIGIVFLTLLVILCTCCIAGCLMVIPFVGSVVLLPITVFRRAYSLYYLAQFGPEFNLFQPSAEIAP